MLLPDSCVSTGGQPWFLRRSGSKDWHVRYSQATRALHSAENLLAFVEGWVDCIVWRAGMAHIPHDDQLREMQRRERAAEPSGNV